MKKKFTPYIISFSLVIIIALIGSKFTKNVKSEWYNCIKPEITPPNWVFPVAWNIIYFVLAIAIGRSIQQGKTLILIFFLINLALNSVWTYFFFEKKRIDIALGIISFIQITLFYIFNATKDQTLKYLLYPYYAWVVYAYVLNVLTLSKVKECENLREFKDPKQSIRSSIGSKAAITNNNPSS